MQRELERKGDVFVLMHDWGGFGGIACPRTIQKMGPGGTIKVLYSKLIIIYFEGMHMDVYMVKNTVHLHFSQ